MALWAIPFLLLQGCVNSMDDIREVSDTFQGPAESQKGMNLTYSDSGMVKLIVKAPKADNFPHAEEPFLEFPEGMDARFFDRMGKEESTIRANYAQRFPKLLRWEARGNVVVTNAKGEKLETEHLIWSEREQKIWSEEFVTLSRGTEVIMGQGFEADQNFTTYTIKKVTGTISIEEDEQQDSESE